MNTRFALCSRLACVFVMHIYCSALEDEVFDVFGCVGAVDAYLLTGHIDELPMLKTQRWKTE